MPISDTHLMMQGASSGIIPVTLAELITDTGITADLILDAGDANSYNGSSQTWTDLSGSGNHWYRGTSSGSDSTDPTFVGISGDLSSYFSFDGGDYFTLVSGSNPAVFQTFHKNNAKLEMGCLIYIPALINTTSGMFTTRASANEVGFQFDPLEYQSGDNYKNNIIVKNGTGNAISSNSPSTPVASGAWHYIGFQLDEALGASGGFVYLDNALWGTFDATYISPSASSASGTALLGAFQTTSPPTIQPVGMRIACFFINSGTLMTADDHYTIGANLMARFA